MDLRKKFDNIILLKSFLQNFKGLMFKRNISTKNCYILKTNGIHTFFMKLAIDVVYLDKNKKVIKKIKKMKPYRFASISFTCKYVLEFRNTEIFEKIKIGDTVKF